MLSQMLFTGVGPKRPATVIESPAGVGAEATVKGVVLLGFSDAA
jgi:hypothetical protein